MSAVEIKIGLEKYSTVQLLTYHRSRLLTSGELTEELLAREYTRGQAEHLIYTNIHLRNGFWMITTHERFQAEIRKLLELDDDYDEPETALDHHDLGEMSQSDLAWHFYKMGFDAKTDD